MTTFWKENQLVPNPKKKKTNKQKQKQKASYKRRAHDLKTQEASQGPMECGIQGFSFASNESKLVPRKLDPGPHLKWALRVVATCHCKTLTVTKYNIHIKT